MNAILITVSVITILLVVACGSGSSDASSREGSTATRAPSKADFVDEEYFTNIANCMRGNGVVFPDLQVNGDGSVDTLALGRFVRPVRTEFGAAKFDKALENCLRSFQGASVAGEGSREDQVQLQNDLLEFAQCLRDYGFEVPNPDYSDGPTAAMGSIIQDLEWADAHVSIDSCIGLVYGAASSGR